MTDPNIGEHEPGQETPAQLGDDDPPFEPDYSLIGYQKRSQDQQDTEQR